MLGMSFNLRRSLTVLRAIKLDLGRAGLLASAGRSHLPVSIGPRGIRTAPTPVKPAPTVSVPVVPMLGLSCALLALCLCLVTGGVALGVARLAPPRQTVTIAPFPSASATGTPLPPTLGPTLTPFPGQVYNLTQSARLQVSPYAPFIFKSETPTRIVVLTLTQSTSLTLIATHTNAVCLLAYPDFCIPSGIRKTCDQLGQYNFTVLPPDPDHYDPDGNGIGCE